jgi:hypothetical protein
VTRGQFRAFIKATGYQTDTEKGLTQGSGLIDEGGGKRWDFDKKYTWDAHYGTREPLGDDHPVTNITWNDAKAFCKWLSETEGRVYDLPTEAQWEFACRAGSITPWHWGAADLARLPEYHNLHGVSEMGPEVVGQRKPNAFGLFNLQGSVLEWCLDYFAVYQAGRAVDPRGPAIGVDRVLRGSTFDCGSPWFLRSACRYLSRPQDAHAGRGFRVVCDPKPAALPGWVQLFNGKDLTGWRQAFPSQWKVDKGVISGAREQLDNNGQLRTEQVFQNFHCRLEVKMNPGGDAVFGFRAALDNFVETNLVSKNDLRGFGSLTHRWNSKSTELVQSTKKLTEDDSWVTLEVIAQGKKATVKVNGTTTAEKVIDGMLDRGFFDFGLGQVGSILQIRKIEIKELPPEAPGWIRGQFLPVDRAWVFSPMEGQIVEVNKDVKANMRVANKQDLFRVFNKELQTKFRELRYEFDEASKVYKVLDDNPKRTPEQTLEMQKARITRDAKRAQLEELRKRVNAIPDRDGEFWIRAPMEGVILTANFGENWMNRQIRPDEPLVHIAKARPDKVEDWELELAIPQSHIGEVRLAFAQLGVKELDVDILVTSAPKDTFKGRLHLDMISPVAVASSNPNDPEPVINARVRLSPKKDAKDILDLAKESMVPHHILLTGVQARARIVQSGKPGWVQLFNGQNTIGWKHHPNQSGGWHVLGGEMIGKGAPVNHLFTDRGDYENFYLRAKVKLDADSMAAVCLRTEFGLSDLDKYPRGYAVLLQNFGELRTGSLTGLQDFKESLAKSGEWFTLEAIAQGPRLTIKVNDKTTADFVDPKHAYRKGHIALRAIGPPQKGSVVFEKIEIKELPPEEAGWTPLFNGKDLTRWIAPPPGQGKGDWHVEDKLGQLVGRGAVASCIVTERDDFADFHLKTEVSCTGGTESGVYFRCGKDPTGDAAIPGYLVATGPTQGANFGALLLTTPDSKKTLKLFNPQAGAPVATFHQLEIVARGNQFTVKVNGKIVTDYKADPAAYTKGRIALRVFSPKGSGDGVVVFKKIEIKELPPMP